MALKKIRLVWRQPLIAGGRWRLGLFNFKTLPAPFESQTSRRRPNYWHNYLHHELYISGRGLLIWGGAAAIASYFAGAALLLSRLDAQNPHNRIRYSDLVIPSRWAQLDQLRAEGWSLQGGELIAAGNFREGFGLLRLSLERHPADAKTRLMVAQTYTALRLMKQARQLLSDGLDHGYPGREYLALGLSLAIDAGQTDERLDLCLQAHTQLTALAEDQRPAKDLEWLNQETVRALLAAEKRDETLAFIEAHYPDTHPFRREITVIYLIESRRLEDAITLASEWAKETPRAPEPLRLLARALREARHFPELDAALARYQAQDPLKPDALLYAIVQNHLGGRTEAAHAALDQLLLRQGANPGLYPTLAAVLGELRSPEYLARIRAELTERGLPLVMLEWARLQIAAKEGDWLTVRQLAASVRSAKNHPLTSAQATWLATLSTLAEACLDAGTGTQTSLVEAVAKRPGTLRLYEFILHSLISAQRFATASQVMNLAEGPYPDAPPLLVLKNRLASAAASVEPEPAVAPAAPTRTFDSAASFATAFNQLVANNAPSAALALLSAVRREQPSWLENASANLDALELPVQARGEDPLRLQLLVRSLLARKPDAHRELLSLSRAIHADGLAGNAVLILKELIRHDIQDSEALDQLALWTPAQTDRAPLDVMQ